MLAALAAALLAPAAPGPDRGAEYVYAGTVAESIDRPGTRFRRSHDLEIRVLILEKAAAYTDAAVLTLLRADDRAKPAARLDLVRAHEDGTVHLLLPVGPAPLRLAADTPTRALPPPLLDTFAPFEFGAFPPRAGAATEPGRPGFTWAAAGFDFVNGERCAGLRGVQKSETWDRPRGGVTAWERDETVAVSAHDGVARRVHRVIRHRDGVEPQPAATVEVRYELSAHTRLPASTLARYRAEIDTAFAAAADAEPLFREAARLGPQPFAARLAQLDAALAGPEPGTPYREAALAVRRRLDAARRGDAVPVAAPQSAAPLAAPARADVGQPAPDFRAGDFRLSAHRGRPAVLVFFMPGQETTDRSLAIADALQARYAGRVAVAPLVVFADAARGAQDRDRLKLTVPVYDGAAAGTAFGVDTFPRFVVIDRAGVVRWAFGGVGGETGFLVREQVDALLAAPTATAYPAGPTIPGR